MLGPIELRLKLLALRVGFRRQVGALLKPFGI